MGLCTPPRCVFKPCSSSFHPLPAPEPTQAVGGPRRPFQATSAEVGLCGVQSYALARTKQGAMHPEPRPGLLELRECPSAASDCDHVALLMLGTSMRPALVRGELSGTGKSAQ